MRNGLAELHTHLGGSVSSDILWTLAHEQGIALPVKDYWEFDRLVTVSDPRGVPDLNALDAIYHWTELIQSSPIAVEQSVHGAIGGAYRSQGITTLELRFNPMKRNRGGERDLDHIILAAVRGLDRASLEYPQVRAGLILMMDRTFTPELNMIIVEEALRPDRIGHGILAAGDPALMDELAGAGIVLEICPTSNLLTKALNGEDALRDTLRSFVEHGVGFTIATDGPEMMRTHLRDELELLRRIGALAEDELEEANRRGHEASFVATRERVVR